MNNKVPMQQYYELLEDILENGHDSDDRTGVGTRAVFGRQIRFDLREGFPLLTGKLTPFKLIAGELLWFLSGSTHNDDLRRYSQLPEGKDSIWEEWHHNGDLGPIYGAQWREWQDYEGGAHDQIHNLIEGLKYRPFSRRHIVLAWNVADLPNEILSPQTNVANGLMALAPCHMGFQMHVRKLTIAERINTYEKMIDGDINLLAKQPVENFQSYMDSIGVPQLGLSCHMYQRSADTFLGVPFNIASYALLTHMISHVLGYEPLELIISFGDVHIYKNHMSQVKELLSRKDSAYDLPKLEIVGRFDSIDDFKGIEDFKIVGYKCLPAIPAPVAV